MVAVATASAACRRATDRLTGRSRVEPGLLIPCPTRQIIDGPLRFEVSLPRPLVVPALVRY